MVNCNKCCKEFTKRGLEQHKTKIPNCINKCYICLKIYASQQTLKKHGSVICKQRYECEKCNKIYKSKYDMNHHMKYNLCSKINKQNEKISEIQDQNIEILDIIKELPDNKNIIINNTYNTYNNNKEINSNNKIGNIKIENKKISNKINFQNTQPKWLDFGYDEHKYRNYSERNEEISEEMADMYMYEEDRFKKKYKESIVFFEKKTLELEGFKMLHTELQKDPKYQNVRIKKSKSGKCHIYNGKWEEIPLQKAITKICSKLCNSLYDKETSVNQFFNLVIGSQPRRMTALRKHIEQNITELNKNQNLIEEI